MSTLSDYPTIEEMIEALIAAGWKPIRAGVWQAPSGALYVGPAGAYRYMKEWQAKKLLRQGAL